MAPRFLHTQRSFCYDEPSYGGKKAPSAIGVVDRMLETLCETWLGGAERFDSTPGPVVETMVILRGRVVVRGRLCS